MGELPREFPGTKSVSRGHEMKNFLSHLMMAIIVRHVLTHKAHLNALHAVLDDQFQAPRPQQIASNNVEL